MSDSADALKRRQPGFWSTVRESLNGSSQNYTEGSVGRSILLLAVPMVLEMVLESVFALTDVFFVGRLGPNAVATVGLTESMLALVYAVAMGLSVGVTATIARRIGEGDAEGAAETAAQGILVGIAAATVLGIAGALLAPRLLLLLGATPAIVATGSNFTRVMLGGEISVILLFIINAAFRGSGDAAIAMRVLWLSNAINIILAPSLVLGLGPFPKLGIAGAAIGTTIGRGTGVLFALSKLVRPGSRIQLRRHHFALDTGLIRRVVRLSGSATFQVFIGMASWIGLTRILATFGSNALAGYTIGIRIVIFALLPTFGLANAAATMVGQALGARKPERAEQAVWTAAKYAAVFLGIVSVVFVLAARPIIAIFTQDRAVAAYAVSALRTIASGFVFYAYGMVVTQSFNGAGDTRTPTWLNLFVFWMLEIPLAYVLSTVLGMGPQGAFTAMTIAFSVLAVASAVLFRRGRWKTRVV